MVIAYINVMNNHLTIGDISMNRPIFTCPHCGGVLVFDDECVECPKCERIVNFDEIGRHIFSDERKVILAKVTCCCPMCDKLFDVERYVEQFAPIKVEDCQVRCFQCSIKTRYHHE